VVYSTVVVGAGDTIAGKYKVDRLLGRGGMGYVVAATHLKLAQTVAIKILKPELCEDDGEVERFLREARASVRIQSEHVARVLDVGALDDGGPYMVIEFLEGRDLAHELKERKALPVGEAVDYVLQASEAVAEAHALGIVHRDLKPANLFRTRRSDGSALIKVLDFGISKALAHEGQTARSVAHTTQGVLGSPCYMSPEQVQRPRAVDTRSDIWSIGVILYELLAGAPPFIAETPLSIWSAVMTTPAPSIRALRPDVPEGLDDVIRKCLEKEQASRYADIIELASALGPYTTTGTAPVSRLRAIMRSARERGSDGSMRPPPPAADPTFREASRSLQATPTLESPGRAEPGAVRQEEKDAKDTPSGITHSSSSAVGTRSGRRLAWASASATLVVAVGALGLYMAGGSLRSRSPATSQPAPSDRASLAPEPPRSATAAITGAPAEVVAARANEVDKAAASSSSGARAEPRDGVAPWRVGATSPSRADEKTTTPVRIAAKRSAPDAGTSVNGTLPAAAPTNVAPLNGPDPDPLEGRH
jgi:serine/threonine-protein kinase